MEHSDTSKGRGSGGCHHSKMVKDRGNPLAAGRAYNSRTWEVGSGRLEAGKFRGQPGYEKLCLKKKGVGRRRGKVERKERNEDNSQEEVDG